MSFTKLFLYTILFLHAAAGISFAQDKAYNVPRQILTEVQQAPEFPGGKASLNKFLAKNLRYPKKAYEHNIEGKVVVRFIVETDGSISNAEITDSVDPDCDKETLRVIRKMPKWNPGRQNGVAAACYYSLPVSFKLH